MPDETIVTLVARGRDEASQTFDNVDRSIKRTQSSALDAGKEFQRIGKRMSGEVARGALDAAGALVGLDQASTHTAIAFAYSAQQEIASLGGVSAAFDALKVSAAAGWLAILGPVAVAGAIGVGAAVALDQLEQSISHRTAATKAAAQAEYENQQVLKLLPGIANPATYATLSLATASTTAATNIDTFSVAAWSARDAADAIIRPALSVSEALARIKQNAADKEITATAQALYDGEVAAIKAKKAVADMAIIMAHSGGIANIFRDSILKLGLSIAKLQSKQVFVDVIERHFDDRGQSHTAVSAHAGRESTDTQANIPQGFVDTLPKVASGGASAAKAIQANFSSAFNAAKSTADRFFKSVHDGNTKAIKDAHDRATAEIAAERRAVDGRLQERKRLNAAPVTAAEQALAATQTAQQERDLREALASAQGGTQNAEGGFEVDQGAVRDAQEALSNFLAQQNIDALKETQAAADRQADIDAGIEYDKLTAKQNAADRTEVLALAAEDKRYDKQKIAYEAEAKLLETHLTKIKATHTRVISEINQMYEDLGIGDKGTGKPGTAKAAVDSGIVINVNGVTDPEAVARSVMLALKRESTRQGMPLTPAA